MLVAPAAQLVLYRPWLARGVRARDCLVLTWLGAILLALYLLWGALELPGVSA